MADESKKFIYIGNISPNCIKPSNSKYDGEDKYVLKFLSKKSADGWMHAIIDKSELSPMGHKFSKWEYAGHTEEVVKCKETGERTMNYAIKMDAAVPRKVFFKDQQQNWATISMSAKELQQAYRESGKLYGEYKRQKVFQRDENDSSFSFDF